MVTRVKVRPSCVTAGTSSIRLQPPPPSSRPPTPPGAITPGGINAASVCIPFTTQGYKPGDHATRSGTGRSASINGGRGREDGWYLPALVTTSWQSHQPDYSVLS